MLADLHTHTTASDGTLPAAGLIDRAIAAGVSMLSITDHDTVAAYQSPAANSTSALRLIPGIEFSSRWRTIGIHIVGLNIDPQAPVIQAAVESQQTARISRAKEIAARLSKSGFKNVWEGASKLAGDASIGRPHFARYLCESGQIKSEALAFKKHLGQGKSCDIRENWPEPGQVIEWITAAGGNAVLAHPSKYKLTHMKLEELARDFKADGGDALEIISGKQTEILTDRLSRLANRLGLSVSCGSDFHQPGQPWAEVGAVAKLPDDVRPVWVDW